MTAPAYFGQALDQTGQTLYFNSLSPHSTGLQAGNASASVIYTLPTAGPAGNNYLMGSSTTGTLSWINPAGTYAPIDSAFVTIGTDATLTSERSLTGTANQVVVTDNGAGSTVVLSTPQNIHTAATPQFGSLGIGKAPTILLDILGTANTDAAIGMLMTNAGTGYSRMGTTNTGSGARIEMLATGTAASGNQFTLPTVPVADSAFVQFLGAANAFITVNNASCPLTIATESTSSPIYFRTNSVVRVTVADTLITFATNPKFAGTNTTGSGSALLGANSPATTNTAPYRWIQAQSSDGSTVYIPCWK